MKYYCSTYKGAAPRGPHRLTAHKSVESPRLWRVNGRASPMRDANTFITGGAQYKVHDGFSSTKLCAAVRCFAPLVHVAATNDLVVHLLSCLHAPKRVSQTHNQRSQMASCLQVCCWQGFCVKLCCATGVSSRAGFVAIFQHTLYPPLPIQCCCCSRRQWVLVSMLSKWLSGTQRCCWSPNSAVHPLHVMNLLRSLPPPPCAVWNAVGDSGCWC